jgi:hypothetical protein
MVATILFWLLGIIVSRFVPASLLLVHGVSLVTALTYFLWACGLAAIIVSFGQLRKLKIQVVKLTDLRCSNLMMQCEKIKAAYPDYAGSLSSPTYLPTGNKDEGARAAIYGFNLRLSDFSADLLALVKNTAKIDVTKPNPSGTASDIGEALREIHNRLQLWLF